MSYVSKRIDAPAKIASEEDEPRMLEKLNNFNER